MLAAQLATPAICSAENMNIKEPQTPEGLLILIAHWKWIEKQIQQIKLHMH